MTCCRKGKCARLGDERSGGADSRSDETAAGCLARPNKCQNWPHLRHGPSSPFGKPPPYVTDRQGATTKITTVDVSVSLQSGMFDVQRT